MPTTQPDKTKSENLPTAGESRQGFETRQVVLLAGGVGGAKLAHGLAQIMPGANLTIIVNTGDDFQHLGLMICPDLDTVLYTMAGVANAETGWGRAGESWRTIEEVARLGGPDWFRLGDLDLATHLARSDMLANGRTLTEATQQLSRRFGVVPAILPMSDEPAPTLVETEEGILPFQTWFVARKWQPAVKKILLPNDVRATPHVLHALEKADLVIIAPSNPFVSIDPILHTYPIRAMINDLPELVIAVSPIIAGQAVKGPAAKMMQEMGLEPSAAAVAGHYRELIDVFVYDQQDGSHSGELEAERLQLNTLMNTPADRLRLAGEILTFAEELLNQ